PGLVKCSKCGEFRLPHRVCKACGTYKGREVIKIESK
ncbi:MAG: 50S ribosomal protein L32, partial [Clostridiales bacterium]|nr:50S ribosomal protein L32 [Clostridiales bacterium]